jgi:probable phosphomutase (TIGR03848 family)
VTTVLLVRHGLTMLTGPVLAGWTPGVDLDDRGKAQAEVLAARLAPLPLDSVVTSPLDRCMQTATAIAAARDGNPERALHVDERVGECRYGDWTGKRIKKLAKDPLWRVVQAHPSGARFPGPDGETLADMQHRAVGAVRDWNAKLGRDACYVICSHADVIKAIVADSLGIHLDLFQRIQVDPCSLTVIRYTDLRPFLLRLNDTGGGVDDLVAAAIEARKGRGTGGRRARSDAIVGGGPGPGTRGPGTPGPGTPGPGTPGPGTPGPGTRGPGTPGPGTPGPGTPGPGTAAPGPDGGDVLHKPADAQG